MAARKQRVDPARDLLDLIGQQGSDHSRQILPQLDTGTVIIVNDGTDGTVVQLDNMQVAASDCLLLGSHAPVVGDRVMVLVHQEEFWILGGIQGQSTGGSSAPAAPTGPAGGDLSGTYPNPSVSAATLSRSFLPGMLMMWPTATPPSGWLRCDGNTVSRATYAALFSAIGTNFNTGSEAGTVFRLPDFRGRVPAGHVTAGDLSVGMGTPPQAPGSDINAHAIGERGGEEDVQLFVTHMPAHHHGSATAGLISPPTITTGTPSVTNTGAEAAHTHGISDPGHNHDLAGGGVYYGGNTNGSPVNRISGQAISGTGAAVNSSPNAIVSTTTGITGTGAGSSHVHSLNAHTHSSTMPNHDHTISPQGGDTPHGNLQPFLSINFIIKT